MVLVAVPVCEKMSLSKERVKQVSIFLLSDFEEGFQET